MTNAPDVPPLPALALEIYDTLMVVATRGWQSVRLRLQPGAEGALRVGEFDTTLGPETVAPRPKLGIEPGAMFGTLNEAVTDVATAARAAAITWSPAAVVVTRAGADRATLELVNADDSVAHTVTLTGDALDQLIFTDALFEAVAAAEPVVVERQRALAALVADCDRWTYDQDEAVLALGGPGVDDVQLPAQVIGTYAHESESWLWGWANPSIDPRSAAISARLREHAARTRGLGAMVRPSLPCGEGFASALASVAAAREPTRGIYRATYDAGVLYLAVLLA